MSLRLLTFHHLQPERPREAVVEAGSFDSTYKLSEDTELGIRLYERGYRVLYHPDAHAFHDHLPYPARNLIRRARVYGADYFYMFGRHPRVMREWAMPVKLTAMDEENAIRILGYVEEHRQRGGRGRRGGGALGHGRF